MIYQLCLGELFTKWVFRNRWRRPKSKDKELISELNLTSLHQIRKGAMNLNLGGGLFSTGIDELAVVCAGIGSR